jgi:primase-polymerase (primpol)-like protein
MPNWILWRWEKPDEGDKYTKVPYQPHGLKAKTNDPKTWSSYKAVIAVVDKFDGIGFW